MNNFLETQLSRISPDFITGLVLIICIGLFITSFFKWRWRDISPALMISAGIIGTFWGTFIALAEFKTEAGHEQMVESIPAVLSGMKTAFVTSLIGLSAALVSKFVFHTLPKPKSEPLPIESDTLELLKQIKDGITGEEGGSLSSQLGFLRADHRDGMTNLQQSIADLKQSIAGDSDSSITTQLIKLRNENVDGLKKLDEHMEGLAETIRTSLVDNMTALMNELREVIVNQLVGQLEETNNVLRQQLTEMLDRIEEALIKQFGETFKQFNQATQAIKAWQAEHREHVEQLTEAFTMAATGIEKIRAECETIPVTMEQLKGLIGEIDGHLKELDERLKAFADMKDAAVQSFPVIHENLNTIGANLQESAEGFSGLKQTISDTYRTAGELAQQHIEDIKTYMNQTNEQVRKTLEGMATQTGEASIQHQDEVRKIMDQIAAASERCRTETEANLQTMRDEYIKNMNAETDRITQGWGDNMIGISDEVARVIKNNNLRQ